MTSPTGDPAAARVDAARVDVAVIGDGPAGSAVALACQRLGIGVVLVGDDAGVDGHLQHLDR